MSKRDDLLDAAEVAAMVAALGFREADERAQRHGIVDSANRGLRLIDEAIEKVSREMMGKR